MGDPADPATDMGPMVDAAAIARTHEWVTEALQGGARALVGGEPDGQFYPPTVLVDVPKDARVCGEEVFAPVVNLFAVADFDAALPRSTTASSACSAASSPTTWSAPCAPGMSWKSVASSSTTSPPGGPMPCRTAV
jgi:NAD-dependent aldehyde dehydrogenases